MATRTTPTHAGLERIIAGTDAGRALLKDVFTLKNLPSYALGLTIMAIVTFVGRKIDDGNTNFFVEWAMLTFVALVTFGLLASAVVNGTRKTQSWLRTTMTNYQNRITDQRYWESAERDPRVMQEILAAQSRAAQTRLAMKTNTVVSSELIETSKALAPQKHLRMPWIVPTQYY